MLAKVIKLADEETVLKAIIELATPHQINRLNVNAIKQGRLDLQNSQTVEHHLQEQMQVFNVNQIDYKLIQNPKSK